MFFVLSIITICLYIIADIMKKKMKKTSSPIQHSTHVQRNEIQTTQLNAGLQTGSHFYSSHVQ